MNLTVNGVDTTIESGPLTSLLDVLREELGVTSPKAGLRAGRLRRLHRARRRRASPLVPDAGRVGRRRRDHARSRASARPSTWRPIQQAFTHHYAAQCGFCTSGMMMAAQAYIDRGGSDDPEAIQEALGGHVCRCTGYVKIIDAVAAVARGDSFDLTVTAAGTAMTNLGGVA